MMNAKIIKYCHIWWSNGKSRNGIFLSRKLPSTGTPEKRFRSIGLVQMLRFRFCVL